MLPTEGSAERNWLDARAAAVRTRVDGAPDPWARWARQMLYEDPVGMRLEALGHGPATGGAWDQVRGRALRASLGQVFTPPGLATVLADLLGAGAGRWPHSLLLDPACGAGSLLVAALDRMRSLGWSSARALAAVEGWDKDPVAAWLCRARLVEWALDDPAGPVPGPLRVFAIDALDPHGRPGEPVGAVISNPPYLESKRMGRAAPGLKDRLRRRFPQLRGAFDLYLAFCWLAVDLLADGGEAALLVPNKVCQGRYATGFRAELLREGGPSLLRLVDISRATPRPFPGTGVYPVALHLAARTETAPIATRRIVHMDALEPPWVELDRAEVRAVGGEHPVFAPLETWPILAPLFAGERLGDVAEMRSTCSFHARGLRERYVSSSRPRERAHRYLGLHSRARRTEVAPFRVRWEGGWIDYDSDGLRAIGNPLPDLDRTFARPKLIWCQHALRMRAVADPDGRWVTKDTYPVGWPTDSRWSLYALLAVFDSTVFTALYNTVYQGIVVGGETYHYLPAFLRQVPLPAVDHPDLAVAARIAEELSGEGPLDHEAFEAMDRCVAAAYGITDEGRRWLVRVHLERVGAEVPGGAAAG